MRILVVIAVLIAAHDASAQYNVPSQASGDRSSIEIADDDRGHRRSDKKHDSLGWELGASLDFLTSDPSLGGERLKFTDVVLFRVHALVALGKHVELFGGTDLLPKQPSFTDELPWQGALLGARFMMTKKLSSYVRAAHGPNLSRDGAWIAGEAAVQSSVLLAERVLFWESTLGGTYTELFLDDADDRFWVAELLAQTGLAIREKKGNAAIWLNFAFHFPLAGRPRPGDPDPVSGRSLDPQVRVGVSIGTLLAVTRSLDLFVEYSILDRGDLEDARTTLPILSGGFDQKRLLFGFNHRFGARRR